MSNDSFADEPVTKHAHELLDRLSAEALDYAEREFGVGHPVWQSIHDQVSCFCQCAEDCADQKQKIKGRTPKKQH